MCTVKLPPAIRSAGPQFSVCGAGVIEHAGNGVPVWPAITQVRPVPEPGGSGSDTVTPCASPVPVLVTVTLNPIGSPAFTGDASAVFRTVTVAGWQTISAGEELPPSLLEVTVAV